MSTSAAPAAARRGGLVTRLRRLGPGLLVTAAFIGPGTVTTASVAGAGFGFALLWALVFSVLAAMVVQEMAARLGVVSREGLGQALRTTFGNPAVQAGASALVIAAITFGNAAFETGNLTGAALGLDAIAGGGTTAWVLVVAVAALALLATGAYRLIERVLVGLVVVMGVVFVVTALLVRPDLGSLAVGFVPRIPPEGALTVIALIGTTVVPYNLFLHASSVQEKWPESVPTDVALAESRWDTTLSIGLGGIVTLAIMSTAAAAFFGSGTTVEDAGQMATQLEPLLGRAAKITFAIGLLAAGVTSAVTAPLAAAYATAGVLGWSPSLRDNRFQAVWAVIIVVGAGFALRGSSPVTAIVFAQAANGILLPIIAGFLLVVMNRSDLLGEHRNSVRANFVGGLVVLVTVAIGLYQILSAFGVVEA